VNEAFRYYTAEEADLMREEGYEFFEATAVTGPRRFVLSGKAEVRHEPQDLYENEYERRR
jgi:hypothetical protein